MLFVPPLEFWNEELQSLEGSRFKIRKKVAVLKIHVVHTVTQSSITFKILQETNWAPALSWLSYGTNWLYLPLVGCAAGTLGNPGANSANSANRWGPPVAEDRM